jgi:tRNA A37 threonylcarbamoyladenosine dehydratase
MATHPSQTIPTRNHLFHRTSMLVGKKTMTALSLTKVAVIGVGGVGGWAAEALVRSGIEHLLLVDSDTICSTNVNRQIQATALNVGKSKVEELRRRLLEINPHAHLEVHHGAYNEHSASQFNLTAFDYVLDAIDSLQNKVLLIKKCIEAGVTVYASMGAAAKMDPTLVRVAPLSRTRVCPLARMVRKRLTRLGVPGDFLCVYSEEMPIDPATESLCGTGHCACTRTHSSASNRSGNEEDHPDWCALKKQINGTVVHVTAVFGLTLASLVIRDISNKIHSRPL